MIVAYRIFMKLNLKGAFLLMASAIISLHPTLVILAGSVNNDMLAILFYISALLWLLRWCSESSIKNTLMLALCVGFGMMTKLNDATLAFIIAPFFLIRWIRQKGLPAKLVLTGKLFLFGIISIPLGMWHPIRNLILLNQPLGYVPMPPMGPNWHGDLTLIQRLFTFPLSQVFVRVFTDTNADYNMPVFVMKTSLFGEWYYNVDVHALASFMIALNIIIILMSLIAMLYCLIRVKQNKEKSFLLLLLWLAQIVPFIFFNIQFPFTCTMDFRYIVPTLISGASFFAIALQSISENFTALWIKAQRFVFAIVILFCMTSAAYYLLM
jgi:4-amino-4-deoxy-L-arabinose transferase-like glycosyltransferase